MSSTLTQGKRVGVFSYLILLVMTGSHPSWISFLRYCNILKKLGFLNTGSFAPQNKGKAQLHPPIFITVDTPPDCGGMSPALGLHG